MILVENLKKSSFFRTKPGRIILLAWRTGTHPFKYLLNGDYRSRHRASGNFAEHYYQRAVFTLPNRHPVLFRECRDYLKDVPQPKILSFGCSTGEEVLSLGEYLPDAQITGVDINEWCLQQAEKKYADKRFSFYHRFAEQFLDSENYDAIFCMAVFQREENRTKPTDKAQGITFGQFEREIVMLDKKLKPGGLFTIDNTDFSFMDTSVSKNYTPCNFERNQVLKADRPLFDVNNNKVANQQMLYRMFVKGN